MKSTIIWVGIFLGSLVGLAYGLLSLFSPQTLERAMEWYTGADKWSNRRQTPRVRGSISQRVAGLFMTLMTGWIIFHLIGGLWQFHATAPPTIRPEAPHGAHSHWSALIVGTIAIALGVYAIIKPQVLLRMTQANFPNRELSRQMVDKTRQGGRVLGVLAIAFGAFLLFLWYGWAH